MRLQRSGDPMTRMRAMTVVVIGALLWTAGCGSSSKTTTGSAADSQQVWANSVCNTLLSWQSSLHSAKQTLTNTKDLSKATIRQVSGQVATANTALVSSLNNLGKPPTPAVGEAKTIVQQLQTQLKSSANQIHNAPSAGSVSEAATVTKQQLTAMTNATSTAVTKLQSLNDSATAAWKKAFSSAKSCQALAST
jgi:hypothetical protein